MSFVLQTRRDVGPWVDADLDLIPAEYMDALAGLFNAWPGDTTITVQSGPAYVVYRLKEVADAEPRELMGKKVHWKGDDEGVRERLVVGYDGEYCVVSGPLYSDLRRRYLSLKPDQLVVVEEAS